MIRITTKNLGIFFVWMFYANFQACWVSCLVEPLTSYPAELETLFYHARSMGDLTQQTGETVFWSCLQIYVSKFADQYSKTVSNMTETQRQFLMNVLVTLRTKLDTARSGRSKRQAGRSILRREIRMLSETERADYFRAINSLKTDTRLPPNVYDFMANFHSGFNIEIAHRGPGFPGWHRVYLFMYEFFLQLHIPSVTLPYWASVLDNEMTDPAQSVIWSPPFMGGGIGQPGPGSGPFSNWTQINPAGVFERNVGFGPLYTWADIREILRRRRNHQILIPTAEPGADFEGIHGGPHMFVGGSMARLNTAARDPIFFMHHAFVDMLWQEFRNRQVRNGINPATDYTFNVSDARFRREHAPSAPMGFFRRNIFEVRLQQLHGLSMFFDRYIRYEPIPSCSLEQLDCGSPYLFCRTTGTPVCVGRTIRDAEGLVHSFPIQSIETGSGTRNRRSTVQDLTRSETNEPGVSTPSPEKLQQLQIPRTRRSPRGSNNPFLIQSDSCPAPQPVNDYMVRENSNGVKLSPNDWVKIPARIIAKRPPQYQDFSAYSLYGLNPNEVKTIGGKSSFIYPGAQMCYRECDRRLQTVGTIKVVSYGLNYDGSAEEYAIIDNRLGIADTTSFIPVRRPRTGAPSEAFIAAFDTCGRVCVPYFFKHAPDGSMMNEIMTGGIRVTIDHPLQYGENYADATLSSWSTNGPKSCPTYDKANAPIAFYCDYSVDWFWTVSETNTTFPYMRPGRVIVPSSSVRSSFEDQRTQKQPKSRTKPKRKPKSKRKSKSSSRRITSPPSFSVQHLDGGRGTMLHNINLWRQSPSEPRITHSGSGSEQGCHLNSVCAIREPCGPCQRGRAYRCLNRQYLAVCQGDSGFLIIYRLNKLF